MSDRAVFRHESYAKAMPHYRCDGCGKRLQYNERRWSVMVVLLFRVAGRRGTVLHKRYCEDCKSRIYVAL